MEGGGEGAPLAQAAFREVARTLVDGTGLLVPLAQASLRRRPGRSMVRLGRCGEGTGRDFPWPRLSSRRMPGCLVKGLGHLGEGAERGFPWPRTFKEVARTLGERDGPLWGGRGRKGEHI